ncbi:MAG: putative Glutathione-regulated potassium-efflux system protein KefB [uncultured Thiotrichaceae bacterium]|uniref:Putative Glutathione-regulated potassium-efflux system protein KefB n=1 Tax=uncultured Thiotrichaceae bacterium TaxID=298394 RepID=A0A6S6SQJ0_9GAMM|nr:MAG: putative Glutathione-regulated potassium-efflux system protein KefB [uncultured Thiotrichaceae bacterium]
MEALSSLLTSIDYHDPIWIIVAYLFGFVVAQIGLPPMVGFLIAGFVLTTLGVSGGDFLNEMADLGVTLLLFTIGLKLKPAQLLRPEVWGVATAHMLAVTVGMAALLWLLAGLQLPMLSDLSVSQTLLLGFALSFSSTVFAVKVFEDKGGMGSHYGRVAIGVLIVQDIAAVIFLAASTAKIPSPWAVLILIALVLLRPVLIYLLRRAGHGELLILFGLVLALGGSTLFEQLDLKGDLGALFFGVLLAQHPKASELAKSLLSLKDLFLVGFFLSIGMAAILEPHTVFAAVLLLLFLPLKMGLFFVLFTRFRLRSRTAAFATLSLANFSEFGLIIAAIAVGNQWLPQDWLTIITIAVVLSFIIASPLNLLNTTIFKRFSPALQKLESRQRLPHEDWVYLGDAKALVIGMGRVGRGTYDHLRDEYEGKVAGVDFDESKIRLHEDEGRNVLPGDSSDVDFWHRIKNHEHQLELVMLCMPNLQANVNTAKAIREWGYRGRIAAVSKFTDEEDHLQKAGVDSTFNMYAEVGNGFAQHVLEKGE